MSQIDAVREARVFCRYLLRVDLDEASCALYLRALERVPVECDRRDASICRAAVRYPFLLGPLDAALALRRPTAPLRRKLTLMAAILETQPAYARCFLLQERVPYPTARLAGVTVRALARACLGIVLLPFFAQ